ncbi:hypothetical protein LSAT2_017824 [Lamellibrachia satsuma]|nr:hypothetical protein LSAT2_017824 [Lamellibrachia satsuma]
MDWYSGFQLPSLVQLCWRISIVKRSVPIWNLLFHRSHACAELPVVVTSNVSGGRTDAPAILSCRVGWRLQDTVSAANSRDRGTELPSCVEKHVICEIMDMGGSKH